MKNRTCRVSRQPCARFFASHGRLSWAIVCPAQLSGSGLYSFAVKRGWL